ncbi:MULTISPECIES: polysaccharide pyruvyl transferase family protein [unclassified Enterococcus]|uniref:polysaccharide pyruvyl transferase family protein n=1 Tax=unclassified Enterococcus TaxID=2608891 RepID=UPI001CE17FB9|nr:MULTISPECIES: polysaccharide pyruvyl transferase family protein [unclassified Enterococcus]MCA5014097.1 polysaccharide pyruvyl transferase family protein [Enterococcus sp. S23]MCA5017129.1 polysaccharide pyruvyl transferase family protein [Enterococcus sp. S22(2020)]
MKIGFMGVDLTSMNKGVSALGFSVIKIVDDLMKEAGIEYEINLLESTDEDNKVLLKKYFQLEKEQIKLHSFSYKKPKDIIELYALIKKMDYVIDITGGDSFSDIYGKKWMLRASLGKLITVYSRTPLMLAPQTYGPFESGFGRFLAKYIVNKASVVLSRDILSKEALAKLSNREVSASTDVAFTLPYDNSFYSIKQDKLNIGINVSQLLWVGGYTQENQFGLTIDYKTYIYSIIEWLNSTGKYNIYIVPHVVKEPEDSYVDSIENDILVSHELKNKYEFLTVAPIFNDPIEAKSYISLMDLFIGSRMHATIASFSSGVPTIPLAYSRKFEGVFNNLGYCHVVDGKTLTTDEAIERTKKLVEDRERLKVNIEESEKNVKEAISRIYTDFNATLSEEK